MTETQIRFEGTQALNQRLGPVDAKRFIALMSRERFDYTERHQTLWSDISLADLWQQTHEQGL